MKPLLLLRDHSTITPDRKLRERDTGLRSVDDVRAVEECAGSR